MKKSLEYLIVFALLFSCFALPASGMAEEKISIVATIFPIYDWVREIAGDHLDDIDLTLLLDNGVDLHSFQATAADIVKVSNSNLFIYVGGESDEWVEDVLAAAPNPDLSSISLVEVMGEDIKMEETVESMEPEEEEDGEEEEADEHVWLSLRNAQKLVRVIADAMAQIDAVNAEVYKANAAAYIEKLAALDAAYQDAVDGASVKTILFGDRFPFRYLADDYGLDYYAAFSGCSAESEASFETIVFLANKVDELNLPAVLSIEAAVHRIAETVANTAKSADVRVLSMDSLQSVTRDRVDAGVTYLDVMRENLETLRRALTR